MIEWHRQDSFREIRRRPAGVIGDPPMDWRIDLMIDQLAAYGLAGFVVAEYKYGIEGAASYWPIDKEQLDKRTIRQAILKTVDELTDVSEPAFPPGQWEAVSNQIPAPRRDRWPPMRLQLCFSVDLQAVEYLSLS